MIRQTTTPIRSILTLGLSVALYTSAHAQFVPSPVDATPPANASSAAPSAHDVALIQAARAGNMEAAVSALESGAGVDARDAEGKTPLMWAAGTGRADLVKTLLERGAQANAQDSLGRSALHYVLAAAPGASNASAPAPKKKRFGGFLKNIGKVAASGSLASLSGDALKGQLQNRLVSTLMSSELGQSMLGQNMASLLNGGSFNLSNKSAWSAILGSALVGSKNSDAASTLQSLLSSDLSKMDASGWVSLLSSAGRGNPQVLEAMGKLGPAVDAAQAKNWTHFLDLASKGNAQGVREMIESGNIAPLLEQATRSLEQAGDAIPGRDGGVSIARALLQGGADVSLADRAGQTALQHAQQRGLGPVIQLLQSSGTAAQAQ